MAFKVFITGATGFIGGEVLYRVINDFPEASVTALVRTEEKAKAVKSKFPTVSTVLGDLSSFDVLEKEYDAADVVITAANVDDEPSAEALAKVARNKTKPFYILHTSGTSVLSDGLAPDHVKKFDGKPYVDATDNAKITLLPDKQPHRLVDKIVLDIEESNPEFVKTVIVCPPAIYGFNRGPGQRISYQVPVLAEQSIKNKQVFLVYNGNFIWSHVHVHDLGRFYSLLLSKLLAKETIPTGRKGYYFCENGTHYWSQVSEIIAKVLKKNNAIENTEVAQLEPKEVEKLCGFDFAPWLWGTNSYSKAELARKLGWSPEYEDKTFFEDVEEQTKFKLGLIKVPEA